MKETRVAAFLFQQAGDHFVQVAFPVLQALDLVADALGDAFELSGLVSVELEEQLAFGKDKT